MIIIPSYTQQLSLFFGDEGLVGTCPFGLLSNSIIWPSMSSKSAVDGDLDTFPCFADTSIIFVTKKFIALSASESGITKMSYN